MLSSSGQVTSTRASSLSFDGLFFFDEVGESLIASSRYIENITTKREMSAPVQ